MKRIRKTIIATVKIAVIQNVGEEKYFSYKGINISLAKKPPTCSNLTINTNAIIKSRQRKSITLSVITVPNNLSIGMSSVLLSDPQRVISPNRGIAMFAKYAIKTASIAFLLEGEYPSGSIKIFHLNALLIKPKTAKTKDNPTQ
jgi:hypothetical protein